MRTEANSYIHETQATLPAELDASPPRVHDLTLGGSDDLHNIEKLTFTLFPEWVGCQLHIHVLDDGLSNQLLRVKCVSGDGTALRFLIRIYGQVTNSLIDRDFELACLITLSKLTGIPQIYGTFNNGVCYSYVDGVAAIPANLSHDEYKWLICDELARFHSLPMSDVIAHSCAAHAREKCLKMIGTPIAFRRIRTWIDRLPPRLSDLHQEAKYQSMFPARDQLLHEVDFLECSLTCAQSPVVLCHNDLLSGNIILSKAKDKVTFIDFEFCAFNHAAFDIGNHFCEYAGIDPVDYARYPSLAFQREWIAHYLSRVQHYTKHYRSLSHPSDAYPSEENHNAIVDGLACDSNEVELWTKEVNYFALVAHLTWGLWAAIRASDESKDFDFLSYAIVRMKEYERLKPLVIAQFSGLPSGDNHTNINHS